MISLVERGELFSKYYYLIDANVYALQRKGKYKNVDTSDQKQIAAISLWLSTEKWKPGIVPFSAFAAQRIRFAISDESRKDRKIVYCEMTDDIISLDINESTFDKAWKYRRITNTPQLTVREKEILTLLNDDLSDREIGSMIGLTHQRVQQIKMQVFDKVKKTIKYAKGFGI